MATEGAAEVVVVVAVTVEVAPAAEERVAAAKVAVVPAAVEPAAELQTTGLTSPYNQPRQIVPPFPTSASDNQQVLYQLADGTGGFVIVNTNDLLGGLEKIAKDQNQYYLLGYKPVASTEGSCHILKVKVDRGGTAVRSRSGYCNARPVDLLAGNPVEKDLETRASGEMKGNVTALMQAPFFYTSPNTAQVHLAVEIPGAGLVFEKVKGKQHAALNILGIAYKPDGSIACALQRYHKHRL